MKEFEVASSEKPIQFKIGEDVFTAVAPDMLPANVLIRYTESLQSGKMHEANINFFKRVFDEESAAKFNDRMDDPKNPITLDTMVEVVDWLTEQYTNLGKKSS